MSDDHEAVLPLAVLTLVLGCLVFAANDQREGREPRGLDGKDAGKQI